MNSDYEGRDQRLWEGHLVNANTYLANLAIKEIEFNNQYGHNDSRLKTLKNAMSTRIGQLSHFKANSKNRKMLPGLQVRHAFSAKAQNEEQNNNPLSGYHFGKPLRNARNSQILNSLIQILKTDPDSQDSDRPKNGRMKTEPSCHNEFIESRQISSVKNSRCPKIINSEIMMSGGNSKPKRSLISQQKNRVKGTGQDGNCFIRPSPKKMETYDEMEMTFYKPSRIIVNPILTPVKKQQENQFFML